MKMNNETVGISAEIAIADAFGVFVNPEYRKRGNITIKKEISKVVNNIFINEGIPFPKEHIAEKQNPIDFILENGKTLSVKSNQRQLGKVAPQTIGQPTSETYFSFLYDNFGFDVKNELNRLNLPDTYQNRAYIFKVFSQKYICEMLNFYWQHIFECDYYLHFYNVLDKKGNLNAKIDYISLNNLPEKPYWDKEHIKFSRTIYNWNESTTIKYYNITIGEFQAHKNRNCLKFRFNIKGILKLLENGLI